MSYSQTYILVKKSYIFSTFYLCLQYYHEELGHFRVELQQILVTKSQSDIKVPILISWSTSYRFGRNRTVYNMWK